MHGIERLARDAVEEFFDGDRHAARESMPAIIYYIRDRMPPVDREDPAGLDALFNAYARVCAWIGALPSIMMFAMLIGASLHTIKSWGSGAYRPTYSGMVKKWKDMCAACCVDRLHQRPGTDANLIFIAKAAYGLVETAPAVAAVQEATPVLTAKDLPRLSAETETEIEIEAETGGI